MLDAKIEDECLFLEANLVRKINARSPVSNFYYYKLSI